MLKFYEWNHPYGWLDEALKAKDPDLTLAYNQAHKWWQVVRRVLLPEVVKVDEDTKLVWQRPSWPVVRDCIWRDRTAREPGDWLMRSIFGGRIQIKTPEDAVAWTEARRKREEAAERDAKVQLGKDIKAICDDAYPAMERVVVHR